MPVLSLTKLNSLTTSPDPGESFEYFIRPRVTAIAPENLPLTILVTDTLPAGVTLVGVPTGVSWSCTPQSTTELTCSYGDPAPIPAGTTLPQIRVPVLLDLSLAPGTSLVNTATVISDDAAQPVDASNTVVLASAGAPLAVTTTTLPGGVVGAIYSATLAATGGTGGNAWSRNSGTLPPGLSVQPAGAITGTPTTAGAFNFSVRVTDSSGAFATRALSIEVSAPLLTITTTSLPAAQMPQAYVAQLAATGGTGTLRWSVISGALPPGLTMTLAGRISGVPTSPGLFNIRVRVTDAAGATTTRAFNLRVLPIPLVIATTQLAPGEVAVVYRATLAATGGTGARTWSLFSGILPDGLSLSPQGVISGVPTVPGTRAFTVRVTDSTGRVDGQRLTLTILPELAITTATLPDGYLTTAYSATLLQAGGFGPFTWTRVAGSLPPGLALSTAGVISGTPTAAGRFTFTVRVRDALGGVDQRVLSIVTARLGKAYIPDFLNGVPGISVVDLTTGVLVTRITVSGTVTKVECSQSRRRCYFLMLDLPNYRLGVINTVTDVIERTRSMPRDSTFRVAPDDSSVFVAATSSTLASGSLLVLNATTLAVTASHNFGGAPLALALSPDGTTAYLATADQSSAATAFQVTLRAMSTSTGVITRNRAIGFAIPYDAEVIPSGNRLVLSLGLSSGGSAIVQFTPGLTEVRRTSVSGFPFNIAAPNNSHVYAMERSPAVVNEVELATGALRAASLGSLAQGLAVDATGLNGYTLVNDRVLTRFSLSSFAATPLLTIAPGFAVASVAVAR